MTSECVRQAVVRTGQHFAVEKIGFVSSDVPCILGWLPLRRANFCT